MSSMNYVMELIDTWDKNRSAFERKKFDRAKVSIFEAVASFGDFYKINDKNSMQGQFFAKLFEVVKPSLNTNIRAVTETHLVKTIIFMTIKCKYELTPVIKICQDAFNYLEKNRLLPYGYNPALNIDKLMRYI